MTKINKKYIAPSVLLTLILISSVYGATRVLADDSTYPRIVTKIAQKFGLKEEEVSEVFEQDRLEMGEERKNLEEERLANAVSEGVITEEQKNKLLEKMNDWQAEKFAQRVDHHEEMQEWFTENGIVREKLMQYLGHRGFGGQFPKPALE